MRDSKGHKLARQYASAMVSIDRLRNAYDPQNIDCIGRIATSLVQLYELFEYWEPDLLRMSAALGKLARTKGNDDLRKLLLHLNKVVVMIHQGLARHQKYFDSSVFEDHFCLVLEQTSERSQAVYYGYSRRKLLKALRAEALHARSVNPRETDALRTFYDFAYEQTSTVRPVFAIRRDFIHGPSVVKENETDSCSAYDESILLKSGESHSLTTIESIVFSICNEHASVFKLGKMNWDKLRIAFEPTYYFGKLPAKLAKNIVEQSSCWNEWSVLQ